MDDAQLQNMQRMVNFAHETAAISLQMVCRILPLLQKHAAASPELAEAIHTCLLRMQNEPDAFREVDLERLRTIQRQLSSETDGL